MHSEFDRAADNAAYEALLDRNAWGKPGYKPAPTPTKCEKGQCTAQMSKAYPGFIQVGDHVYSLDRFVEEFGEEYDITIEERN
jgi:hypothetical protein